MAWIVVAHFFVALTVFLTLLASVWRHNLALGNTSGAVQSIETRMNLGALIGVAFLGIVSALFLIGRGYAPSLRLTGVLTLSIGWLLLQTLRKHRR
jgi:hypothetical protein